LVKPDPGQLKKASEPEKVIPKKITKKKTSKEKKR
jgi:hypothetical protein